MTIYQIKRYREENKAEWDAFVKASRNGTFLLERDYMDYHSDRFCDSSLMVYKGNRLVALLPANIDSDGVIHSHQGLTYGGWILPPSHLDGADLLEIFQEVIEYWKNLGVKALDYKPIPSIYSSRPSEEDLYALFRLGAKISEVNLSSTINLKEPILYNKLRKRSLKKAQNEGFSIEEVESCDEFMNLVTACLKERHDTLPVHTSEEIAILKSRFPENIRMFGIRMSDISQHGESRKGLEAGVMIYDTGRVAHAQYIASTPLGRDKNLLTPLFDYLIKERYKDREYFDFGISNENHGAHLNEGLLRQKFSYGATGVCYSRYLLKISQ